MSWTMRECSTRGSRSGSWVCRARRRQLYWILREVVLAPVLGMAWYLRRLYFFVSCCILIVSSVLRFCSLFLRLGCSENDTAHEREEFRKFSRGQFGEASIRMPGNCRVPGACQRSVWRSEQMDASRLSKARNLVVFPRFCTF